jgi:hypothetical protein
VLAHGRSSLAVRRLYSTVPAGFNPDAVPSRLGEKRVDRSGDDGEPITIEAVNHVVALATARDESRIAEPAERLGQTRRREPDEWSKLLDRPRALGDQFQDA